MPDTWGIVYAGPSLEANLAENWQEGLLECDHEQEPRQRTDALFDFIATLRTVARDTIFFDGLNSSVLSAKVRCTREDFGRIQEHFARCPAKGRIEENFEPRPPVFLFACGGGGRSG